MEQQTGSKLGKEYVEALYCHPAYLTYMQIASCEMLGWMNHKLESRLLEEISTTSDMQMGNKRAPRWRWKRRVKKAGLKLNIQKTKIVASDPITSWQIDEEKVEIVTDFVFLGSKISADSVCSHVIKRCLLLAREAMTNLLAYLKAETSLCQQRSI